MAKITLHRKGWIDTTQQSPNQCKDVAWGRYTYDVSISCHENNTDENDFIIDNTIVHQAIIECFGREMSSCEGMVKKVGWCLYHTATLHGVTVYNIKVTIKPRGVDDHSFAWFDWEENFN